MALKPDRIEDPRQDIRWYMNEVAERGGVVSVLTTGSGGYPGNPNQVCTYAAAPSGKQPLGILLVDMVNINQATQHLNFYKEQVPLNYKVVISRKGEHTTNMILGTPVGGAPAYLGASGLIATTNGGGQAQIGTFQTSKDEDGYASVRVNL